jgi:hypothetical protein
MSERTLRSKVKISLKPSEDKFLEEYCEKRAVKPATVVHDIFTMTKNGDLVTRSGKNYFTAHD